MEKIVDHLVRLWASIGPFLMRCSDTIRLKILPVIYEIYYKLVDFFGPRWKKYLTLSTLIFGGLVLVYTTYVYIIYRIDYADLKASLESEYEWLYGRGMSRQKPPIKIYDRNRQLIGVYLPVRGSHMTMSTCKKMTWLNMAAVSSEDKDFYDHSGVSYKGIGRAFFQNIIHLSMSQGGGTITQQLARNLFTDRARTLKRKLYETFIAGLIEDRLNKEEILCLYLNKIYMGEGRIGAEEAAWFYFKKPPEYLTPAEAAMIVGLFPSPVRYSPLNNIELSLEKQKNVLEGLVQDGHLDSQKEKIALQTFLKKYELSDQSKEDPGLIGIYGASRDFRFNIAPAVNDFVKTYLYENLEDSVIMNGGLKVFTTIDKQRQQVALNVVRQQVDVLRTEMLAKSKKNKAIQLDKLSQRINGVLISMKSETGEILALVGSYSVTEGNMYRRPLFMRRQPGSSLKGFLYAVAMDENVIDVNSLVQDVKFNKGNWYPRNWNGVYLGEIPVRKAIAISSNSAAIRTLDDLGVGVFRRRMMSAIDDNDSSRFKSNLTLALGSGELTPVELTRIYSMINNGGKTVKYQLIASIEDQKGEIILANADNEGVGDQLLSEESCQKAVKLMSYVFDPEIPGTASFIGKNKIKNPKYLPFDIAGKTGTVQVDPVIRKKFPGVYGSQNNAWFVGLVPGETTVVWYGNDEGAPISRGGTLAASTWASFAQSALNGKITGSFVPVEIEDELPETDSEEIPDPNQDSQTDLNTSEQIDAQSQIKVKPDKTSENPKSDVKTPDTETKNTPANVDPKAVEIN